MSEHSKSISKEIVNFEIYFLDSNKNRSPFRDNLRVPYFRYQKPNRDYRINVLSSYDKSVVDKSNYYILYGSQDK